LTTRAASSKQKKQRTANIIHSCQGGLGALVILNAEPNATKMASDNTSQKPPPTIITFAVSHGINIEEMVVADP
jgi:hypothetical protein